MQKTKILFLMILSVFSLLALSSCKNPNTPYSEEFDAPSNWRTGSTGDATGEVVNGVYDFTVHSNDNIVWSTSGEGDQPDGMYVVETRQLSGPLDNGYGMMFHVNDETDDFYLLQISGDGYVWIGRYHGGGEEEIVPMVDDGWFESTAVKQGLDQLNILRARVEGANMIFYVNDQEVGRVTDDTFPNGEIGLLMQTFSEGEVRVQFDNFIVTPIDAIAPERY